MHPMIARFLAFALMIGLLFFFMNTPMGGEVKSGQTIVLILVAVGVISGGAVIASAWIGSRSK